MGIGASMKETCQEIAAARQGRAKALGKLREEAGALIKGFETSRREGGARLRADLAHDQATRKSETEKMLNGLHAARKKEGAQLRQDLAQGVAGLRSQVKATLGNARQAISNLQSPRREAGSKLRADLAQSRSSLRQGVRDLLGALGQSRQETGNKLRDDLSKARADQVSTVTEFRSAVRSDLNEARAAWQELTRKVGSTPVTPKQEAAKGEPKAAEEEVPDVEAKVLAAVTEHSQGISLEEIAASLGVARIVLGHVSKRLLDQGKIRKEDKLYFPVSG